MSISLTHPRIVNFFNTHTHIRAEDLQLQIIDLLEKNAIACASINNAFQINELRSAFSRFNETIQSTNRSILTSFLAAKAEYVREYNALVETQQTSASLVHNHQRFAGMIHTAIFSAINEPMLKTRYPSLHDKLAQLTKQFNRVMENNIIAAASNTMATLRTDYIANFETNAEHMAQSAQNILSEFASAKDAAVSSAVSALNANAEGSMPAFYRLQYELADFVRNAAVVGPQNIEYVINQCFPAASAVETDSDHNVVLGRDGKPDVLVGSICCRDRNVHTDEIRAFVKQCQIAGANGVLVSQYTGISGKPNYHIDIQNHHTIVFVHSAQFSPEKIKLAIDMADSVYAKLSEMVVLPEYRETISKDTMDDINREYQQFILQKETFAQLVKDTHKKMTAQLDDFRFPSLDRFLCTRYASCKKQGYTCDLCGTFNVPTLKGLAAHKRGCLRKTCRSGHIQQQTG